MSRRGGFGERLLRGSGMSKEMVETYHREMVDDGALHGGLAWYRALPLTSLRSVPGSVSVPTTMVWSDGDDFIGRRSIDLTERFVTADYRLEVMAWQQPLASQRGPAELAEIIADSAPGSVDAMTMRRTSRRSVWPTWWRSRASWPCSPSSSPP